MYQTSIRFNDKIPSYTFPNLCIYKPVRLSYYISGYFLELDTARTARSAGIPMGPRAVLPSNTCGAHQTFHDWL